MRRVILVNALIFAVLAAAVALAYYGYSFVTAEASRDREEKLMTKVALEKVTNIETPILEADQKLFGTNLPLDTFIDKLSELTLGIHLNSVFVLNDQLELIPSGYHSAHKEGVAFRDWFMKVVLPDLKLAKPRKVGERDHLHAEWDDSDWRGGLPGFRPYLFSFVKKFSGDKPYYIVIEEDLNYLYAYQFPYSFPFSEKRSELIYQVIDAKGIRYGLPTTPWKGALVVEEAFLDTMDMWKVRVFERDDTARIEQQRKRLVDSLFIGGSVTVMLTGLLVLVLAIRRERRANELKSEFISNVSHELKTPLSIISMFGEMLANGRTKGPDQATEYADIIWRESVRLGRLIDNVLDFAKIERGKGMYEFAETDIGEVVERAVDLVGRRLATAEMSIDVKIDPELPQVELDANAFTLAVMNLIDNATKYAADGKRIELKLQRQGERIVLSVRDFGPGIDPDEQEQIFERFYRARAVRLKPIRGSGIGLALVRHIARAHRGDVSVESAAGKGSTFRIWLPVPD